MSAGKSAWLQMHFDINTASATNSATSPTTNTSPSTAGRLLKFDRRMQYAAAPKSIRWKALADSTGLANHIKILQASELEQYVATFVKENLQQK